MFSHFTGVIKNDRFGLAAVHRELEERCAAPDSEGADDIEHAVRLVIA